MILNYTTYTLLIYAMIFLQVCHLILAVCMLQPP